MEMYMNLPDTAKQYFGNGFVGHRPPTAISVSGTVLLFLHFVIFSKATVF